MLHVILLESALELVPSEISPLKEIQQYAYRRGKKPNEIALDQTHHGKAMMKLTNSEKRGRPDIIFHSLVTLLETPLCKEGFLSVYIHLQDGRIIIVNPKVRLPRNYDRFIGLMEQLLIRGRVPYEGEALLQTSEQNLSGLVSQLTEGSPDYKSILTIEGGEKTPTQVLSDMFPWDSTIPVVVGIGAFPHGDFSDEVKQLFDNHIELDTEVMMAWHVCAEILWVYSQRISLIRKRFGQY
ncbi:MAG: 16S rRNA methyltransferase [Candidatus Thorarchaeota archaeon]|nr:16S rRNA methyltransferase [Candidatus Thorarchaeota archaeon]